MTVHAHLVGSINLESTEAVLRAVAQQVGAAAPRIPDGETGDRLGWNAWQISTLRDNPHLEEVGTGLVAGLTVPRFAPRDGVDPAEIAFTSLGYAEVARASYAVFRELRDAGVIAPGTRFQVSLPTPAAVVLPFVEPPHQLAIEAPFERALLEEVHKICRAIEPGELAFQWDAPAEVGMAERVFPHYFASDDVDAEVVDRLVRLGAGIPDAAELGYHLCYGDTGDVDDPEGSHWKDPEDLALVTRLMNGITAASRRHVDFFHVPVPIRRDDASYFAPLRELALAPGTELFLGLLHREDGVEGARRRIAAARRAIDSFGVAAECGLGRERQSHVPGLLALHGEIAAELREQNPQRSRELH